jgi:hypothetical protein
MGFAIALPGLANTSPIRGAAIRRLIRLLRMCPLLCVLLVGAGPTFAQSAPPESEQFQARVDEVARSLASNPRLKNLTQQQRRDLTEFVVGNMLFVLLHEMGHTLIPAALEIDSQGIPKSGKV